MSVILAHCQAARPKFGTTILPNRTQDRTYQQGLIRSDICGIA
jgi:hypothetical protein